jgi:hypothetical protein
MRFPNSEKVHSSRLLAGNLSAFLPRLGKSDGDRLLAAFHGAASPAFAQLQSSTFPATHRTGNGFLRYLSIFSAGRSIFSGHGFPPWGLEDYLQIKGCEGSYWRNAQAAGFRCSLFLLSDFATRFRSRMNSLRDQDCSELRRSASGNQERNGGRYRIRILG